MGEKSEVIAPVFKNKSPLNKGKYMASRPAVRMEVNDIRLTAFRGANPSLVSEIAKVIIRYAH
ncbi:hypothetical protein H5S09_02370 [Limosilactobacillus sp. STM2_1]|uniref:Uncharacterized protein n=1 Tax=Limosilactobacillus rudii TaxID=2759755 RepID=A0A7W3YMS0_9LACO|nr:hypothetical protein [Limosilactobacillus rudii]MBB1080300.1 hypothetical protein [Limosilactobacillus rudii]MBB1096796.1 hypothetical protein [Limosilactobacillus rudii]MCD7133694.1 hypothetical protein [Limosilactobacillus rudii]